MISGGNKSKLIRLNLVMIPNLNDFLECKKLKIVNTKINPSCNIHMILKFYVSPKCIRAVSLAVLQKIGQWGKILMVRI